MSDNQQEQAKKVKQPLKRPVPPATSTPALASLAETLTSFGGKHSDVSTAGSQETQQSKNLETQTVEHSDIQTSRDLDSEQSKVSKARKSKHPEWRQKTVYLPPDLEQWLNVQSAIERREISEIVADALQLYRDRH